MANTDNPHGFKVHQVLGMGSSLPLAQMQVDTNITLTEGDAVKIEDDGYINIAATTNAIFGIAAESVTGAAGTRPTIGVIPALPNIIFSAQTSGDAAVTDIGENLPLEGTTGIQELNEDGSDGAFKVIGLKPGSEWGTNAELLVVVVKNQWTTTA